MASTSVSPSISSSTPPTAGPADPSSAASSATRSTKAPGLDPRLAGTSIVSDVLGLIGDTPLVRLARVSERAGLSCLLTLKQEATNPGGSAKDRPALQMILEAEARGDLRPGQMIVEPTSGNTGVGLAIVAAQRGYRCTFVVTDKVAPEKIALLRAYGGDVVVCPVNVSPDDERSYYKVAERLARELGAYRPDQYSNPSNPRAHFLTTGPEIWSQTAGRVTHFVAGAGTCGTVSGVARFLKGQNPDVRVIVADPDRSLFSGGSGRPYRVEGVGEDFFPAAWDRSLYDEVIPVSDRDAFQTARWVSRTEGVLVGGSGGLALAAALQVARRLGPGDLVVVLNPDSGRGYLSRVFDDAWMYANGFLHDADAPLVGDALASMPTRPWFVNMHDRVGDVLASCSGAGLSHLAVVASEPPFAPSEILGTFDVEALAVRAARDASLLDASAGSVMGSSPDQVGVGEPIATALQRFTASGPLVVFDGGYAVAMFTGGDVAGLIDVRGRS